MIEEELTIHKEIKDVLDPFFIFLISRSYFKLKGPEAVNDLKKFTRNSDSFTEFESYVTRHPINVGREVIKLVENFSGNDKNERRLMRSAFCSLTISVRGVLENSENFDNSTTEMQLLRHLRNGSAHGNLFSFSNKVRQELNDTPVIWRNKKLTPKNEGEEVYFDFMAPGDLFVLLSDISKYCNSSPRKYDNT